MLSKKKVNMTEFYNGPNEEWESKLEIILKLSL